MTSRKTQEKLARSTKLLSAKDNAEQAANEPLVDEAEAQKAFEKMMEKAREHQAKAEAEAQERYDKEVAARLRFISAIEKLADALEHVAVRIAFDHGVKQAAAPRLSDKVVRSERADPKPELKPGPSASDVANGEQVREAVRAVVKAGKGHEAVELLAKFNAESVSDLKPADFPTVLANLRKLMEG